MRKFLSLILTMAFALSLSASPVRAEETDYEKIVNEVNRTNGEINRMIDESVEQADRETENYASSLEALEKGPDAVKLDKGISDLRERMKAELNDLRSGSKKTIEITDIINEFESQIDGSNSEVNEMTNRYNERINGIIDRLIDYTNKKAADMKERAAEKGIVVICEFVSVEIGGQVIKVDPLRIIGF